MARVLPPIFRFRIAASRRYLDNTRAILRRWCKHVCFMPFSLSCRLELVISLRFTMGLAQYCFQPFPDPFGPGTYIISLLTAGESTTQTARFPAGVGVRLDTPQFRFRRCASLLRRPRPASIGVATPPQASLTATRQSNQRASMWRPFLLTVVDFNPANKTPRRNQGSSLAARRQKFYGWADEISVTCPNSRLRLFQCRRV